jgi:phage shock protein PspC (stress-responsive transcriptional regulator)
MGQGLRILSGVLAGIGIGTSADAQAVSLAAFVLAFAVSGMALYADSLEWGRRGRG